MKFQCQVKDEDLIAFVRHYIQHSAVMRRQVRNLRLYPSVAVLIFFGLTGALLRYWFAVGMGLFSFALLMVILKPIVLWSMVRNSLRIMKEGGGVLGHHEFELADGVFVERANGTEMRTTVENLHEICESESHVFVYINPLMAHIIPRRDVTNEVVELLRGMTPGKGQ